MQQEKIFADGFSFKRRENAPDFVVGRMSIKVDDAIEFLKKNSKNGWVNLNVNTSRNGSMYCELDTYEPKKGTAAPAKSSKPAKAEEDLPF